MTGCRSAKRFDWKFLCPADLAIGLDIRFIPRSVIVFPNVSSYDVELPYDWILLFELSGRCGQQLGKGKVVFVVSVLYDFS